MAEDVSLISSLHSEALDWLEEKEGPLWDRDFLSTSVLFPTVEEGDYGIFVLEGEVADVHELVVCRRDAGRGFPIRMLDGAQDKTAGLGGVAGPVSSVIRLGPCGKWGFRRKRRVKPKRVNMEKLIDEPFSTKEPRELLLLDCEHEISPESTGNL